MRRSLIVIRWCWLLLLGAADVGCVPGLLDDSPLGPGGPATQASIAGVSPDYDISYVQVADTLRLVAVPEDAGGFPIESSEAAVRTWKLSDPVLASLEPKPPSGQEVLVTGLVPGMVTVTATVLGVSGMAHLTVLPRLGSVVLTPAATELVVGDSVFVSAIISDTDGHELSGLRPRWLFGDSNVASFRDIGVPGALRFYAAAAGTYVVQVRIAHVTSAPATIHVITAATSR